MALLKPRLTVCALMVRCRAPKVHTQKLQMARDSHPTGASRPLTGRRCRALCLVMAALLPSGFAVAQATGTAINPTDWASRAVVVLATVAVVVACVTVHYEALSLLTVRLRHLQLRPRAKILVLIFAILFVHVIEVWIFGGAYYWLTAVADYGALLGGDAMGLLDCVYFSAVCFSTLGLGDIVPTGDIRFLVGTESLTGFVLITWSASFTFVEMERFWRA